VKSVKKTQTAEKKESQTNTVIDMQSDEINHANGITQTGDY
jgi:hypothetical protein